MRLYGSDSGLFQLLGSFALISAASIFPVLLARTATAQSRSFASATVEADSEGAPLADDTAPAATMDRPAPSADYDLPADASASPDKAAADAPASSGATSETSNDSVLEIPQVINPSLYAACAATAVADGSGMDDDAVDELAADMPAASADDSGASSGSDAQATLDDETGDAQDYADQDDETGGGGPVVVYAAPIYIPQYVVSPPPFVSPPPPQPYAVNNHQLPMYSALMNRTLPMYSGLNAVPGRYGTAGGSRLWASHLGQGFMIHGGFGHR
jgi:hypothetical protein